MKRFVMWVVLVFALTISVSAATLPVPAQPGAARIQRVSSHPRTHRHKAHRAKRHRAHRHGPGA